MPNLSDYKKRLEHSGKTIGQVHKKQSDMIMEATWDRDIQSKKCYIFDYFHDPEPWKFQNIVPDIRYNTPIDAKFIITSYQSMDKDQVTYLIQFRPSEKLRFTQKDNLYYYETDYRDKYNAQFPAGMYILIPNEKGEYDKWIICAEEKANQFTNYLILPVNYVFNWIEVDEEKRIIRKMCGVTRSQNSYNSGLWSEYISTNVENQFKAILPMNSISEKIFYVDNSNQNQRMVISANIPRPITWQVSKVETMTAGQFGLSRLTFKQVQWNSSTDYIDKDAVNPDGSKDLFAMYADYYSSTVIPQNPTDNIDYASLVKCNLTSSTNQIKAGGSYKTITALFSDENGNDITEKYLNQINILSWKAYVDDIDITNEAVLTWKKQDEPNIVKVKFNDKNYLTKNLVIKLELINIIGELELEIVGL